MPEFRYVGLAVLQARAMGAVTAAVNEAAEDLVGKAQDAAPVDTGTLRASIHTDGAQVSGHEVTARIQTGGEANEYAIFQHEGTSKGVPATKFLEIPLIENAPVYREALERAAKGAF